MRQYEESYQQDIEKYNELLAAYNRETNQEQYYTNWIDTNNLTKLSSEFLSSLDSINHPFSNLKDFFTSLIKSIIAFNASEISGKFESKEDTRVLLQDIKNIEAIIQDIKSKIQKETNFNDKVKLNIDLKTQKDRLEKLKEKL